ncbi:MAG: LLM class flavin-dependent oxidoreductase [Thermoleophilia bacterium]|nr:LLM class flavin-dependent oxidoreductase [Thermoleophilia bacterium]
MKFGLLLVPQVLKGQPEPFHDMIEQIEFAEELGYDSVWLTEHHFSEYGRAAVPALTAYAIARTRRIRVGTAVVVLPFHHPIRVAEDWATLDHLSKGRVDVGVGRGSQPNEFAGFGVSLDEARERFDESLEIIRKCWTQETVSHDGRFLKIPEIEVLPKPYQQPHPPLWQAAVSAYTTQMVVDHGINGLIGPYLMPYDLLKRDYFDVWHTATAAMGRTDLQMCHNEFVYVGETDDEVKRDVEDAVMWYVRKAAKIWGERIRSNVSPQYANYTDVLERFDTITFDEVFGSVSMFGTPDRVAEKMRWMRDEGGCDYIMNFTSFGGIPHEKAMRSMELFAREVMSRFKGDVVVDAGASSAPVVA